MELSSLLFLEVDELLVCIHDIRISPLKLKNMELLSILFLKVGELLACIIT